MEQIYRVYVLSDAHGRILDVSSDAHGLDLSGWQMVDQGLGDRYLHAQAHYLPGALMDARGVPCYKLHQGQVVPRTQAEMDGDWLEPAPVPTMDERMTDMEEALRMILEGVTE